MNETQDQRVSASLGGIGPDQVAQIRDEWNTSRNGVVIRAVFADRLNRQINERTNKLKVITPDQLIGLQREIAAFELALTLCTQNPLTNE